MRETKIPRTDRQSDLRKQKWDCTDEDISKEEILKQGLATPEEYEILEKYTLALSNAVLKSQQNAD